MDTTRKLALALALALPAIAAAGARQQHALAFDGTDDYVLLQSLPPFINDLSQDFTITFWLRREGAGGRVFYAQRDASNFATFLLSGANALFYVKRDNITYTRSIALPALGEWHHYALRWTGAVSLPEVFVDGVMPDWTSGGASSFANNATMTLGARTDGMQPLAGSLDDFSIWTRLRSLEEIAAERVSTCVPRAGLQAEFDFDVGLPGGDNTGVSTLPDVAGVHGGTLQNFALTGGTSNWIASPFSRIAPALVFDPPLASLATGEDGSGYTGTVRLAVPPVQAVTLALASDTPAEATVAPAALEFTPANWDQPQAVTIAGVDDGQPDGAAAFAFTATSSSADPCQDGLTVSQAGSNAPLVAGAVAIADVLQAEGEAIADFEFPVTYTGTLAPPFSVSFATQDGSAVSGTGYVATSGTLAFSGLPGESRTIAVPVPGNRVAQADRTFQVLLGVPTQAGIGVAAGTAQGSIVDDDLDVRVTLDDGVDVVEPGQSVSYDLVVENLSPTLDAGAVPLNFVAVPLQQLAWTCVPSGGASCAGGSGVFAAQPVLPAGAQAAYTVTGTAAPTLGATGGPSHLVASATAMLAIDSQPGDNTAVDVDAAPPLFADGFE